MKKRLLFIYNPLSGTGAIKSALSDIMDIMIRADYEVTVYPTQAKGDAIKKAFEEADNFDRIVAGGGDGTLDEVVCGLMKSKKNVAVGYIPAGSTNDFASSIGIEKDILAAAKRSVTGEPASFDLGRTAEDYFIYVAAFGIFTEVSYQTSQELKNIFGHAAYVLEAAKQLRDIPSYRMQVESRGNVIYDEFIYGMVSNSDSVGGFKGIVGQDVSMNDGRFEVTLIRTPKNPMELSDIIAFLTGRNRDSDLVLSFHTDFIRFTASEEVPWTLDGEFGGKMSEMEISVIPNALTIYK